MSVTKQVVNCADSFSSILKIESVSSGSLCMILTFSSFETCIVELEVTYFCYSFTVFLKFRFARLSFFVRLFCSHSTLTFFTTCQQNFLNHFQTAQAALTAVTVQAAEMAASSMKDFAKKSFRLLMDVNLKAPVIIVPESAASRNALVADLGLIRVQNEFRLVSSDESSLPPVTDNMDVQLTHLKLSRYTCSFLQS